MGRIEGFSFHVAGVILIVGAGGWIHMKPRRQKAEGRRHPRSALGTRGTVYLAGGRTLDGIFLDVSYGGARMEVGRSIDPRFLVGQTVKVEIPTLSEQGRGRLGSLVATIVWAKPRENGKLNLGLRFSTAATASLRLVVPGLGRTLR